MPASEQFSSAVLESNLRVVVPGQTEIDVAARLSVAQAVNVRDLGSRIAELYVDDAIVPDPKTYRPLTEEEYRRLVVRTDDWREYADDPTHIILFPEDFSDTDWEMHRKYSETNSNLFGVTYFMPNTLTTTLGPKMPDSINQFRIGMHLDINPEEENEDSTNYLHRLGINSGWQERGLLACLHTAAQLSERAGRQIVRGGDVRELGPEALGGILRIHLCENEMYKARTGRAEDKEDAIVHDGTTLLGNGNEGAMQMAAGLMTYSTRSLARVGFVGLPS